MDHTRSPRTKQQRHAAKLRQSGLISFTRWILPEHKPELLALIDALELKAKEKQ